MEFAFQLPSYWGGVFKAVQSPCWSREGSLGTSWPWLHVMFSFAYRNSLDLEAFLLKESHSGKFSGEFSFSFLSGLSSKGKDPQPAGEVCHLPWDTQEVEPYLETGTPSSAFCELVDTWTLRHMPPCGHLMCHLSFSEPPGGKWLPLTFTQRGWGGGGVGGVVVVVWGSGGGIKEKEWMWQWRLLSFWMHFSRSRKEKRGSRCARFYPSACLDSGAH